MLALAPGAPGTCLGQRTHPGSLRKYPVPAVEPSPEVLNNSGHEIVRYLAVTLSDDKTIVHSGPPVGGCDLLAWGEASAGTRNRSDMELPFHRPSWSWRLTSSVVMGLTGTFSRGFLYGLNKVEVSGLPRFLEILDKRKDLGARHRGLLTVSNHVGVLDDPLIWGILPVRYTFNPSNMRWSLGAHDICFKNKLLGTFFSLGQVLPTHRAQYSPHGGPFQPTMQQAVQLLSSSSPLAAKHQDLPQRPPHHLEEKPGFFTYTTDGVDSFRAPSIYAQNRLGWVHVFPEGCVHQHPDLSLRYFKWGMSRLILESEPVPDVLPMFVDGTQHIMAEDRPWPRFAPRVGANFKVVFGELLDSEKLFGDLRARWRELVEKDGRTQEMGELSEELKYGREAVELRIEVAKRVRDEIEKLRVSQGYPEDPEAYGDAETWAKEPRKRKYRSNVDGSLVKKE